MTYSILQVVALVVGGIASFAISWKLKAIAVGCFLAWAFVMIGDRIALEFIPRKGFPALPGVAYITIAIMSGFASGFAVRMSATFSGKKRNVVP